MKHVCSLSLFLLACGGGPDAATDSNPPAASYANESTVTWDCDPPDAGFYVQGWNAFYPEGWIQYDDIQAPYEIRELTVELLALADAFGSRSCDPRVGVEILAWVSDTQTPMDYGNGTGPMTVPAVASAMAVGTLEPNADHNSERVTVTLDTPIAVVEGQRLFLGYRHAAGNTDEDASCVGVCLDADTRPYWQHNPGASDGNYVFPGDGSNMMMLGATLGTP